MGTHTYVKNKEARYAFRNCVNLLVDHDLSAEKGKSFAESYGWRRFELANADVVQQRHRTASLSVQEQLKHFNEFNKCERQRLAYDCAGAGRKSKSSG